MEPVLQFTHFLSLCIWTGSLIFLLWAVLPVLRDVLSDDLARLVTRHVLRAYYLLAGTCAVIAVLSLMGLIRGRPVHLAGVRLAILLGMSVLTAVAGWVLQPRIEALFQALRDGGSHERSASSLAQLTRLDRLALQINSLVLLLGLLTVWLSIGGPHLPGWPW
ncbi:MAG: DUF4149 domain-containing protein [Acidobacteriota bacterium]